MREKQEKIAFFRPFSWWVSFSWYPSSLPFSHLHQSERKMPGNRRHIRRHRRHGIQCFLWISEHFHVFPGVISICKERQRRTQGVTLTFLTSDVARNCLNRLTFCYTKQGSQLEALLPKETKSAKILLRIKHSSSYTTHKDTLHLISSQGSHIPKWKIWPPAYKSNWKHVRQSFTSLSQSLVP